MDLNKRSQSNLTPIPRQSGSSKPGRKRKSSSIRTRLTLAFILMALLPLAINGVVSGLLNTQSAEQRIFNQLDSVATLKEAEINSWADNMQNGLVNMFPEQNAESLALILRENASSSDLNYKMNYTWLQNYVQRVLRQNQFYEEIFLLDRYGRVKFSSDTTQEGKQYSNQPLFTQGIQDQYLSKPMYSPSLKQIRIIVSQPLSDTSGEIFGVVAARAKMEVLNNIMLERAGLGQTGETYLVGDQYTLVTGLRNGSFDSAVRTTGTVTALQTRTNGSGTYKNAPGELVFGVYRWIPRLQVALLAEQTRREALFSVWVTTAISFGLTLVGLFIAIVAGITLTRSITNPLAKLAGTAKEIASGNLGLTAPIERDDEIGELAAAFNRMAQQLQEMIAGLEQRVTDRTRDLERRTLQLQAAAEIARDITTATDLDELINRAVNLVRDRFGFYHAGLFLVDERGEYAVLQAATGEPGRQMLERGHKLKVGEVGIVGFVTGSGQPRIALDVGADAVHFRNPHLPQTRSEMALPLRVSNRIIGALDVQSIEEAAFSENDVTVLQTMADQLAIAIENARLILQMNQTLAELAQAYGQYTQQSWLSFARSGQHAVGYRYNQNSLQKVDSLRPEVLEAMQDGGQTVVANVSPGDGSPGAHRALAVPIRLRNQVIGVLNLRFKGDRLPDGSQELVETISSRLALVLENARLLEEARMQTAQEQQLGEITGRMRQSLDIETVLKTAAQEIYTALGLHDVTIRLEGDGTGSENQASLVNTSRPPSTEFSHEMRDPRRG